MNWSRQNLYRPARKVLFAVAGLSLLIAGLAMLVLPGPAIIFIPLSLWVLGKEFSWPQQCLRKAAKRARKLSKQSRIHRAVRGLCGGLMRRSRNWRPTSQLSKRQPVIVPEQLVP